MRARHGPCWPLALVLAAGCVSAEVEPAPPAGLVAIEPHSFYVDASFGYDPEHQQAVPYEVAGEARPVTLEIEVMSEEFFELFDERLLCRATFTTEEPLDAAGWVTEAGMAFGVELPAGAALDHDCHFLPSATWGEAEAVLRAWTWGVGVGPLDPEVLDGLQASLEASGYDWEVDYAPYVAGGGLRWDLLESTHPGGFAPFDFTLGYEADADLVLLDTEGEAWDGSESPAPALLLAEDMETDLPRGVYLVQSWFGFDATLLLSS